MKCAIVSVCVRPSVTTESSQSRAEEPQLVASKSVDVAQSTLDMLQSLSSPSSSAVAEITDANDMDLVQPFEPTVPVKSAAVQGFGTVRCPAFIGYLTNPDRETGTDTDTDTDTDTHTHT